MANLYGLDAVGNAAYIKATGTGGPSTPYLVHNDAFTDSLKSAFVTNSGNANVITAASGTTLRVIAMTITSLSGCTVQLQSGGSSDLTPPMHIGANGNLTQSNSLGLFQSLVGQGINAVVSGSTVYTVMLSYRDVVA
jgi:hypothetical protein